MRGKFDRNYRLDIFTPSGKQITISRPFSIHFNLTRNTLASANKASITLYNLGPGTRNQIFKDRFTINEYWRVSLYSGYGNRLHEVFKGNMYEAYSYKEKTEWITVLDCFDGMDAIQNGFTSVTIEKETPKTNIIQTILSDMPNIIRGSFGSPTEGQNARGKSLLGQSAELIGEETGGKYFIDGEVLNVLDDNEVLPGQVVKLDSSDLLSTPKRREAFLDVSTLFEPQLKVGRIYDIESLSSIYNGQYKVIGFTHDVYIGEDKSGVARSDISLYFGAEGLKEVL